MISNSTSSAIEKKKEKKRDRHWKNTLNNLITFDELNLSTINVHQNIKMLKNKLYNNSFKNLKEKENKKWQTYKEKQR